MGIAKQLKQGRLHLNTIENRLEIDHKEGIFIHYLDIAPTDGDCVREIRRAGCIFRR